VELLKNLFGEYQDCTFREITSPKSNEITAILGKDNIATLFQGSNGGTKI
jgi:hypothetical protein